ncbi:pirin family protein [Paraburkholderia sp. 1N]|uniref:Pirin family protein n=2 Tax=Paraburkholderia solitsugae TaxID=2675748 RepID=A0ABX2C203_9BURK|nr:pirin family protein [Paraburkholderia solitsugae]
MLGPRRIVFRTRGRAHGGITRLASPSDLGDLIKPFVFLDHAVVVPTGKPMFGMHPHSGIATLTTVLSGAISYQDTTGKHGELHAGGLEWMKAGNGVWHDGDVLPGEAVRLFQLWVALPPAQENSPAESQYISPSQVQRDGPLRVILGRHGAATSDIRAPEGINYFHVQLSAGESWRYVPPAGHNVSWLAIDKGRLHASEPIEAGQLAVFEESDGAPIELQAEHATSFVIGSAIKHPYPLVLGHYSVHTNADALAQGEAEIRRIGRDLAGVK